MNIFARSRDAIAAAVLLAALDLIAHGPPSGDPDILSKQWRLTLSAGGDSTSATVLTADYTDIATASVYGMERF